MDFLSQVEHDPDAAAVLVTTWEPLAHKVIDFIKEEIHSLPRREILLSAINNHSAVLLAQDFSEAIDFINLYAPEHLQILTREPFARSAPNSPCRLYFPRPLLSHTRR